MIQDFGAVGEFVTAVATLATLVYLASQVRAARHSNDFLISQGISQQFNFFNSQIAQDAELAEVFTRGVMDPDSLSDLEATRFEFLVFQAFHTHNMIHELGAGGVISERWIRGSTTDLAMLFSFPGTRRLFARNRSWFGPEMASIYEAAEPDTEPNWRDREYRDEGPRRDQSE